MSDMHVKNLFYRLVTEPDVTFHKAPPREGETPEFKYRIDSQHLTIEMKDHYSVGTEARKHVEPYLRAWQIDSGISFGRNAFRSSLFALRSLIETHRPKANPTLSRWTCRRIFRYLVQHWCALLPRFCLLHHAISSPHQTWKRCGIAITGTGLDESRLPPWHTFASTYLN